jgi:hydrogenase nickel incorporation protein HypA/HybF
VGVAFCFGCSEHVEIASRADACSRCGAYQLQPIAGTELKLIELTVHDA